MVHLLLKFSYLILVNSSPTSADTQQSALTEYSLLPLPSLVQDLKLADFEHVNKFDIIRQPNK